MAETSEKGKVAAGWYFDKRWPGEQRRWDGQQWLNDWRPLPTKFGRRPEGWMMTGALLALGLGILSGVAFSLDETFGWWVLWTSAAIAGTVFNIGAIGKAVELGVRAARGR